MAAKKGSKKPSKKRGTKKAAKRSGGKKGHLVAKVPSLPKARKGYLRFLDGNEVREVKARRGGTRKK